MARKRAKKKTYQAKKKTQKAKKRFAYQRLKIENEILGKEVSKSGI